MLEKLILFHLIDLITLYYWCENEWVGSLKKSFFKMLGLSFSSKLGWDYYVVFIQEIWSLDLFYEVSFS